MNGNEIKEIMKQKRIFQWEVAQKLHINEFTLSRWLRGTPTPEHEIVILNAIQRLSQKE